MSFLVTLIIGVLVVLTIGISVSSLVLVLVKNKQKSNTDSNSTPVYPVIDESNPNVQIFDMGPVGMISAWPSIKAPSGWLICDGKTYNTNANTEFLPLFNVIGNTYGGTNGTNFKVPDLRGRTIIGLDVKDDIDFAKLVTFDVSGIDSTQIGTTGGNQNMQQHNHSINDPGHAHYQTAYQGVVVPRGGDYTVSGSSRTLTEPSNTGITINNTGTGLSQNMQPSMVLTYIIKYK